MKKSQKHEFIERVMDSQRIIHKICRLYCKDQEQHKDLSQEILIQLWKSYPSFRGDAKFSSWMYRVALNVAIQHLRKSSKKPFKVQIDRDLEQIAITQSHDNDLEENVRLLHMAIRKLNAIEKAIIMLHLEEKKNEEIAQIIGITQNHVRVKMNRIKKKLKETLNPKSHGV